MVGPVNGFDLETWNEGVLAILPPPFEWCFVKGGAVVLEDASRYAGTAGGRFEVPDFLIAKYPITNAQYEIFVVAKDGYDRAEWWDYSRHALAWRKDNPQPRKILHSGDDLPRINVCWYEAVVFCRWLDAQIYPPQSPRTRGDDRGVITLPTEQQWQRAAIGDTGWKYPWGNEVDPKQCNSSESGIGKPTPVTQYPSGASPYGVLDMSGNVWEWCLTGWGTDDVSLDHHDERVLRGGSFTCEDYYLRAANRFRVIPDGRRYTVGLRCVLGC
jgi:formylglycine-generating enzyme required for sulfatase activity